MRSKFLQCARLLVFLVPAITIHHSAQASDQLLVVEDAHIPQPPPGASVAAGYFTLINQGDQDITLTGASSESFGRVEIHESTLVDGVSRMEFQSSVIIPAGGNLEFRHGGYHLMLMSPLSDLTKGMRVAVRLVTDSGPVDAVLTVRSIHGQAHKEGHNEGHGTMTPTQ